MTWHEIIGLNNNYVHIKFDRFMDSYAGSHLQCNNKVLSSAKHKHTLTETKGVWLVRLER